MIIGDLCDEYAVLVSQDKAPAYGYDNTNVPYGLVIDDDGALIRVRPLGDFSGKKPVNIIPVPARFPRSSGIVANFLCDNVTYLLGCDTKGNAKRAAQAFQACGELHRRILDGVKDRAASAVCAFFSKAPQWQTAQRLMGDEAWKSSVTMNFALEYDDGGQTIFIGELPRIREAWDAYYGREDDADESALVSSLVSGERIVPEKVHPKIKGVAGAQSSGASLISFNASAFCSHGAEQNENAPMSKREAYEYISKIRNDSTKPTRTTANRERTMTDRKPIENRYDFTILFDVKDGNPNGDPDSGNMPRVDIETGNGLTTDVCIKRKIRDYVQTAMGEQAPWRIYIQNRQTLNRLDSEALKAEHVDTSLESKDFAKEIKALKKTDPELDRRLRDYMCDQFFDIRTFGAVMTTFVKGSLSCGQVRGPVQLGFARSIDPISVQEISITRIAVTTEADAAEKNNTMGNKFIIPYGLYRMNGYISAKLAQNVTGFCDEDLDVLWQAILNMFEFDRSAARGNMAVRKLYVFKHSSALGDAPSWKLFDSINVHKRAEVDAPRDFADYEVRVNREAIPESVSLTEMVDHAL